MKVTVVVLIPIWLILASYFGSGGVTSLELSYSKNEIDKMLVDSSDKKAVVYKGMEFSNISAAKAYKEDQEYDRNYNLALQIFPWLNLPYHFMGLLITSFAFGFLGATLGLLKEIVITGTKSEDLKVFSKPLLGGGCGIIILGLSYILPLLFTSGETEIRSLTIVFASLFAGLFIENFFEWLSNNFNKIFKN